MKTQARRGVLLLVLTLLLGGCAAPPATDKLEGTITVSGAFALYPMVIRWGEEFTKLNPGVQFDISAGGAGKGMADVLGGAVDIGMVSRDVSPDEEAQGAYWVAVTKDAVFPTVNETNPVLVDLLARGVTQEIFKKIYITGEITTWGEVVGRPEVMDPIHVYTRSDAAGAPDVWAKYLGKKQENLLGIGVFGDPGLAEAVVRDPLGIGYNNLNYAYDPASGKPVTGLAVIPLDVNANGVADDNELLESKSEAVEAVRSGAFPSPPARMLNLVTNGKPDDRTLAFLQWVITDGQKYLDEVGYVSLTQEQIAAAQAKLR
jgi:phosphate transport system substrate-binding protein